MSDLYRSPIEIISQIQEDLNIAFEDGVFKAVQRVGIRVDKEELLKALAYDRGQYMQGYRDALKELIRCRDCENWIPGETKDDDTLIPPRCKRNAGIWIPDDYCSYAEMAVKNG